MKQRDNIRETNLDKAVNKLKTKAFPSDVNGQNYVTYEWAKYVLSENIKD